MKESFVESTVTRWAKDHGVLTLKLASPSHKGQPDRMYLHAGKAVFIEFKKPGGKITALQEKWLEDLNQRGFPAECHDHPAAAIGFLKKQFGIR